MNELSPMRMSNTNRKNSGVLRQSGMRKSRHLKEPEATRKNPSRIKKRGVKRESSNRHLKPQASGHHLTRGLRRSGGKLTDLKLFR